MPHTLIPYLIAVFVLGLVIRRSLRHRRLRLDRLWIVPALLRAAAIAAVVRDPPADSYGAMALALAALAGAAVGWQRGRLTRINLDAETGVLTSKASTAAVILIVALLALRFGVRMWMAENPHQGVG
jgi:hypothetical protein